MERTDVMPADDQDLIAGYAAYTTTDELAEAEFDEAAPGTGPTLFTLSFITGYFGC